MEESEHGARVLLSFRSIRTGNQYFYTIHAHSISPKIPSIFFPVSENLTCSK